MTGRGTPERSAGTGTGTPRHAHLDRLATPKRRGAPRTAARTPRDAERVGADDIAPVPQAPPRPTPTPQRALPPSTPKLLRLTVLAMGGSTERRLNTEAEARQTLAELCIQAHPAIVMAGRPVNFVVSCAGVEWSSLTHGGMTLSECGIEDNCIVMVTANPVADAEDLQPPQEACAPAALSAPPQEPVQPNAARHAPDAGSPAAVSRALDYPTPAALSPLSASAGDASVYTARPLATPRGSDALDAGGAEGTGPGGRRPVATARTAARAGGTPRVHTPRRAHTLQLTVLARGKTRTEVHTFEKVPYGEKLAVLCKRCGLQEPDTAFRNSGYRGFLVRHVQAGEVWGTRQSGRLSLRDMGLQDGDELAVEVDWARASPAAAPAPRRVDGRGVDGLLTSPPLPGAGLPGRADAPAQAPPVSRHAPQPDATPPRRASPSASSRHDDSPVRPERTRSFSPSASHPHPPRADFVVPLGVSPSPEHDPSHSLWSVPPSAPVVSPYGAPPPAPSASGISLGFAPTATPPSSASLRVPSRTPEAATHVHVHVAPSRLASPEDVQLRHISPKRTAGASVVVVSHPPDDVVVMDAEEPFVPVPASSCASAPRRDPSCRSAASPSPVRAPALPIALSPSAGAAPPVPDAAVDAPTSDAWRAFVEALSSVLHERDLLLISAETVRDLIRHYGFDEDPVVSAKIELQWKRLTGVVQPSLSHPGDSECLQPGMSIALDDAGSRLSVRSGRDTYKNGRAATGGARTPSARAGRRTPKTTPHSAPRVAAAHSFPLPASPARDRGRRTLHPQHAPPRRTASERRHTTARRIAAANPNAVAGDQPAVSPHTAPEGRVEGRSMAMADGSSFQGSHPNPVAVVKHVPGKTYAAGVAVGGNPNDMAVLPRTPRKLYIPEGREGGGASSDPNALQAAPAPAERVERRGCQLGVVDPNAGSDAAAARRQAAEDDARRAGDEHFAAVLRRKEAKCRSKSDPNATGAARNDPPPRSTGKLRAEQRNESPNRYAAGADPNTLVVATADSAGEYWARGPAGPSGAFAPGVPPPRCAHAQYREHPAAPVSSNPNNTRDEARADPESPAVARWGGAPPQSPGGAGRRRVVCAASGTHGVLP